jgi:Holliday junction resolvase RusA-like endonuclease
MGRKSVIELELPFVIPFRAPQKSVRRFFNPLSKEKEQCQWVLRSQFKESKIYGPISVLIAFEVGVAASISNKRRKAIIGQINGQNPCLKKLDLDNLMKFVGDCLKGIVIEDDSQIWNLSLSKVWAEKDRTRIWLVKNNEET